MSFRVNNTPFTERHAYLIQDALKSLRYHLSSATHRKTEGVREYNARKILEIEALEREFADALSARRVRVRS